MPPCAPSTVRAQAWDRLGAPSLRVAGHEGRRQDRCSPAAVEADGETRRRRRAVTVAVVPLTSRLPSGPQRAWSSTRSPARYSRSLVHPGPAMAGPAEHAGLDQAGPDAVGEVLGVGVGHDQRRHLLGAVPGDVVADGVGHGLRGSGPGWRARAPSRARPATVGTAVGSPRRSRPRACRSAGSTWRRLTVSRAEGIAAVVGERVRCGRRRRRRRPAGTGGGRPAPIPTRPGRRPRAARTASTSAVEVWEISSSTTTVPGRQRPVGQVDAQPGDRLGVQAGAGQLGHRLGRGGHRHHRPAVGGGGLGGGVQHRGLAVPGRRQHGPQAAALTGQHPHRRHLILPQSRRAGQRRLGRRLGDSRARTGGQGVHQSQRCGPPRPGGRRSTTAPAGAGPPRYRGSGAPPGPSRRTGRPWR